MKTYMLRILLLIAVGLLGSTVQAQSNDFDTGELNGWRVVDITSVRDLQQQLGTTIESNAQLAPNGHLIAWVAERQLCIAHVDILSADCYSWPKDLLSINDLRWSPNSQYIAFHEPFALALEPDIWVFEVDLREFTNLTDDRAFGNEAGRWYDRMPVWDPSTGDLYFLRVENDPLSSSGFSNSLVRIPAYTGGVLIAREPQFVADLTPHFSQPFPVYSWSTSLLEGRLAISPDGSSLAMIAYPYRPQNKHSGVWLINLKTGAVDLLKLWSEIQSAHMPSWYTDSDSDLIDSVAWNSDGTAVLVVGGAISQQYSIEPLTRYVDVESRNVIPLLDIQVADTSEDYFTPKDAEANSLSFDRQYGAVITPDRSAIIYYNKFNPLPDKGDTDPGFSALRITSESKDNAPIRLVTIPRDEHKRFPLDRGSIGSSDNIMRVLSSGYLLTFEQTVDR